jgi:hypothetical protein
MENGVPAHHGGHEPNGEVVPRFQRGASALASRCNQPQQEESMRISVIGTGNMGSAVVERLCKSGHEVTVYNRTRAKAEALTTFKARVADSLAAALQRSELTILSLIDAPATLVVFSEPGISGVHGRESPCSWGPASARKPTDCDWAATTLAAPKRRTVSRVRHEESRLSDVAAASGAGLRRTDRKLSLLNVHLHGAQHSASGCGRHACRTYCNAFVGPPRPVSNSHRRP